MLEAQGGERGEGERGGESKREGGERVRGEGESERGGRE